MVKNKSLIIFTMAQKLRLLTWISELTSDTGPRIRHPQMLLLLIQLVLLLLLLLLLLVLLCHENVESWSCAALHFRK